MSGSANVHVSKIGITQNMIKGQFCKIYYYQLNNQTKVHHEVCKSSG